ncbi:MAG TPA: N-acetylmuramoyl-L-alanine amidase [Campylobacterales bacterium]|nr:N-acetylmuramoyl-L-alanine amidase [Campylobacterales bacterium]
MTHQTFAQSGNFLRKSELHQNRLELTFKYRIDEVNNFIIPSRLGVTKYVYDIKNGVLPKGINFKRHQHPQVKAFRVGQNRTDILRVVIESTQQNQQKYTIVDNRLIIPLPLGKVLRFRSKNRKALNRGYNKKKIVIDAGHGGRDNGASFNGIKEKNITLIIAKKLKAELQKKGYRVYMTRQKDKYIALERRTEYANKIGADMFISLHANAAPSKKRASKFKGIEIFYLSLAGTNRVKNGRIIFKAKSLYSKKDCKVMVSSKKIKKSRKLAWIVRKYMLRNLKRKYRNVEDNGVRKSDFWVLLGTKMPSILVETGYLTDKLEGKRLMNGYYQNLIVKGISEGVLNYFRKRY